MGSGDAAGEGSGGARPRNEVIDQERERLRPSSDGVHSVGGRIGGEPGAIVDHDDSPIPVASVPISSKVP